MEGPRGFPKRHVDTVPQARLDELGHVPSSLDPIFFSLHLAQLNVVGSSVRNAQIRNDAIEGRLDSE